MKFTSKKAKEFANSLNFKKGKGLVCAVAQSQAKDVLMVAFMDKRALLSTLTSGQMHYYSRSRQRLWRKGEESGNTQQMLAIKKDCDGDALLFTVNQKGPACHTNAPTCFGKPQFDLLALAQLIEARKKRSPAGSYTKKLLTSKKLAIAKVREESEEFIEAVQERSRKSQFQGKKDVTWECADLLYHTLCLAYASGISIKSINNELCRRHSRPRKRTNA